MKKKPEPREPKTGVRLNRYLASCGLASRRAAEEYILRGQVRVNRKVVRDLATRVDPAKDRVEVSGKRLEAPAAEHVYLMMHKPPGCDVTRDDPHAPKTIHRLLPGDMPASVQAVGRLDRMTTGLLLLTNDGDLAYRLTHPRFEIEKEYIALGALKPTANQIRQLAAGVQLDDGAAKAVRVEPFVPQPGERGVRGAGIRLTIREGRNRIVRRMCDAIGYKIHDLHRIRFGPLRLRALMQGTYRKLRDSEVEELRRAVGFVSAGEPPKRGLSKPAP